MAEPVGNYCPGCLQLAELSLAGGQQDFCGNEQCHVLSWDPTMTLEELQADMSEVDWPEQ